MSKKGFLLKYSELIKLLKKNNIQFQRHGKSHDIWYSQITGRKFEIPRHKKEIPTDTCIGILKSAGIQLKNQKGD